MQEQEKYTIGEFSFRTFHEYRDGQEDVRKIECINKELNIQDPEVAVRLYNDIRSGKVTFKTPIGDQFFSHLADIVADKSVGLLEDKAVVDEAEGKVRYQKIIGLVFIALAVVSFAVYGIAEVRDIVTTRKMQKMATQVEQSSEEKNPVEVTKPEEEAENPKLPEEEKINVEDLTVLPEYQELLNQNGDMVGWISIADTSINYPVVQKDDAFYLSHNFEGKENANGTIFADPRCDIVNATTNTIIYGHNMKSGMMFGGLKNYLQADYMEAHKIIAFDTIYEHRQYEIIAVCLSKVQYQDTDAYRYYDFISAKTEQELAAFMQNVNELAVYGDANGITLEDKLLTLSTCNSYTEDGRLFVVAKQIK